MATHPTGDLVGDEAVVHLDLRVHRADGSTFNTTRQLPLPPVALPGLQPGVVIDVRYLPEDESYVAVNARMR